MTLLETLISLGLLSLLASASLGWVAATQRGLAEASASTTWRRAADQTLSLLYEDITSGDTGAWDDQPLQLEPGPNDSVTTLAFSTRSPRIGPASVVYRFDASEHTYSRVVDGEERLLLGETDGIWLKLVRADPELSDGAPIAIDIEIRSRDGASRRRTITLGPREVQR